MNTLQSASGTATSAVFYSSGPNVTTLLDLTNSSGVDVFAALLDATAVPTFFANGSLPTCVKSARIPSGTTYKFSPRDAITGMVATRGAVLVVFDVNSDGSPNYTALGSHAVAYTANFAALA
jgi:hypothetical protein